MEKKFVVFSTGFTLDGHEFGAVAVRLSKIYKMPETKIIKRLLDGKSGKIKSFVDKESAEKLAMKMERLGLNCYVYTRDLERNLNAEVAADTTKANPPKPKVEPTGFDDMSIAIEEAEDPEQEEEYTPGYGEPMPNSADSSESEAASVASKKPNLPLIVLLLAAILGAVAYLTLYR